MALFKRSKPKQTFEAKRNGRKYRMGILFALMILACAGLCTINPILVKVFAEVVGGIVGIYIVYCGGNVANKAVLGKWQGARIEGGVQLGGPPPPADPPVGGP